MKSFVLRLEEGVHEELKSRALRERRSMHAVALLALEEFLGGKPVDKPKAPEKEVEAKPDKPSKSVGTSGGPSVRNVEPKPVSVGATSARPFTGAIPKPGKGRK